MQTATSWTALQCFGQTFRVQREKDERMYDECRTQRLALAAGDGPKADIGL